MMGAFSFSDGTYAQAWVHAHAFGVQWLESHVAGIQCRLSMAY